MNYLVERRFITLQETVWMSIDNTGILACQYGAQHVVILEKEEIRKHLT